MHEAVERSNCYKLVVPRLYFFFFFCIYKNIRAGKLISTATYQVELVCALEYLHELLMEK